MLALNELNKKYPTVRSILQDFFERPSVYPHLRTIGIEITGYDFDNPQRLPATQKIANVISLVWALMKRYRISAKDISGHLEIQLSKPDPGKKFLALIKFLIGIKALIDQDDDMRMLVYGPFLNGQNTIKDGVLAYFQYLREYMILVASPRQVSEWDVWSKYFPVYEMLHGGNSTLPCAEVFYLPLLEPSWQPGYIFLDPDNHEGIDIYPDYRPFPKRGFGQNVHLLANGVCVYLGKSGGLHDGQLAIFRHRQVDGSEVITSYGHLNSIANIEVGGKYSGGQVIGKILTTRNPPNGYLHFSIAYGPAWDIYLRKNANIPLNVGPTWINNFFINPDVYFTDNSAVPLEEFKDFPQTPI
jgi:hypothetical protein